MDESLYPGQEKSYFFKKVKFCYGCFSRALTEDEEKNVVIRALSLISIYGKYIHCS